LSSRTGAWVLCRSQ